MIPVPHRLPGSHPHPYWEVLVEFLRVTEWSMAGFRQLLGYSAEADDVERVASPRNLL